MKIARITNDNKLLLADELIELTDYVDNYLSFNGIDDTIDNVGVNNFNWNEGTWEFWIRTRTDFSSLPTNYYESLFGVEQLSPSFRLRVYARGSANFYFTFVGRGGNVTFPISRLIQNEWTHIAITYSATNGQMESYIDGVRASTSSFAYSDVALNTPFSIGKTMSYNNFNGDMKELRIWNKSLTALEIQENMNKSLIGNETDLALYFPMTEIEEDTLIDKSNNGNDGTFNGVGIGEDIISSDSKVRISSDGILYAAELIEYPTELEGGRNLLSTSFEKYDTSGLYGYIELVEEDTETILKVYDRDSSIDMSSIYFGFTGVDYSAEGNVTWSMANGNLQRDEIIQSRHRYFSYYPKNEATFNKIFERFYIKIEKGNKATPWTPAPEDLGLDYSEDISSFGIRLFDDMTMVSEIREIDTLIDVDLTDGGNLFGWSGGYTTSSETPGIYSVTGTRGGMRISSSTFETGETYELSFKIKKISGDILSLGGHAQSFENMEVYLNNNIIGNNWGAGLANTHPNDDLEHNYRVVLKYNGSASDSNLYIQPNRNNGYSTNYVAEIWDLKLEKRTASWYST